MGSALGTPCPKLLTKGAPGWPGCRPQLPPVPPHPHARPAAVLQLEMENAEGNCPARGQLSEMGPGGPSRGGSPSAPRGCSEPLLPAREATRRLQRPPSRADRVRGPGPRLWPPHGPPAGHVRSAAHRVVARPCGLLPLPLRPPQAGPRCQGPGRGRPPGCLSAGPRRVLSAAVRADDKALQLARGTRTNKALTKPTPQRPRAGDPAERAT